VEVPIDIKALDSEADSVYSLLPLYSDEERAQEFDSCNTAMSTESPKFWNSRKHALNALVFQIGKCSL